MASGLLGDLFRRRVPHVLGVYLAVGWGVLEFVDWLVSRYALSPFLTDFSLVAWALMIPSVLMLAYLHGATGTQRWTRIEKIGIPANVLAAAAALVFMLSGGHPRISAAFLADAGLDPRRIAVLYFDDDSEAQDLGHLASAFTGALIDEFTRVKALDVVPRRGVRPYRRAPVSLDSIAGALRTGTLVEGSVSGSKERLIVSAALIDPASQTNLESFTLEGAVDAWADLRDDLAKQVARTLRRRLGVEIRLRERRAGTQSAEALALVERAEGLQAEARELVMAGDSAAAARALDRADLLLARAESLDSLWVEPIVMRGAVAMQRSGLSSSLAPGVFDETEMRQGIAHAERALRLAPREASALELRGRLRFMMSRDPALTDPADLRAAAETDLRAAVAADPSRARAWAALSELHRTDTRYAEALLDAERALEADPFLSEADVIIFHLYASAQDLRDMDEAVRWCHEGHRRFPERDWFVACSLFVLALSRGPEAEVERAWALADTLLQLSPPHQNEQMRLIGQSWVAAALARAGRADSARSVIERVRLNAPGELRPWMDYYGANVRLLLGERDEALALLRAHLDAVPQQRDYIASDWMFEDLWDDPRFKLLVGAVE